MDAVAVTVAELIAGLGVQAHGPVDATVRGLAHDSRRVVPGDLFFALPGAHHDGLAFAREALARGAAAVVAAAPVADAGGTVVVTSEPRRTLAEVACRFHRHPSRALRVVGVTGTNGKTTTTWLLESVLRAAGFTPGVIGTTGIRVAGEARPSAFTTPEAPELQALLREMLDRGVTAVALEVSSHALAQRRSLGLACDVAVFTNLTHDHLDFHGTLERYLDAKLMLFDGRNDPDRVKPLHAAVNLDDPRAATVIAAARRGGARVWTFGGSAGAPREGTPPDIGIDAVEPRPHGLRFRLVEAAGATRVELPLLGRHNAWNSAAAFAAGRALGVPAAAIAAGLAAVPAVPGRLERVEAGQAFQVVVDYAHTPDALAVALAAAREHAPGRVLVVFGCGGDRDRAKRPLMGAAAEAAADRVWITSDNPRSEDPAAIAAEIAAGVRGGAARVVLDRREAIAESLAAARPGDLVLIAGKGHEATQTIGDRVLPFDDRAVARELLGAPSGPAPRSGAGEGR